MEKMLGLHSGSQRDLEDPCFDGQSHWKWLVYAIEEVLIVG
jgi:hypothetical protein